MSNRGAWFSATANEPADGPGKAGVATPDVTSFDVKKAQRFVVLGSAGMWKGLTGQTCVDLLATRLNMMDSRRAEIEAMLSDDIRLSMQGPEKARPTMPSSPILI